jgi:trimeric autotransporter adhesin
MSITKDIWSPLLGSKIVSRTSKELTRSLLGVRTLMNPLLLRRGFPVVLLALALGLFALSPTIRAVDPPPDGGYPNSNTAEGDNALFNLTTGFNNTAIGFRALFNNTSGGFNTASGYQALFSNTTGNSNTATGSFALLFNTIGNSNTATGVGALNRLTTGSSNTAEGQGALHHLITGSSNIALGFFAGANLTTGSNNIEIGNVGLASDANMIRIGKVGTQTATFVAGIRGVTVASGIGVIIGSNGQLGTVTSSARFKEAIKPMDKASEAILALKPVTFRYKHDLDPDGVPQFGLVAEQVEKVNPDLVVRDEDGKVSTVRYEAVNAMLLNEFLKEHRKVEEQQGTIAQLKTAAARQQKQIEALAATVQKVSNQLELNKAAQQVVANNQ